MRECLAMSVPSGMSGEVKRHTGHVKPATTKALRESVRDVRDNFYCLTYARARVDVYGTSQQVCINSLGFSFFPGQAGQKKEIAGIFKKNPVRLGKKSPDKPGQAGQKPVRVNSGSFQPTPAMRAAKLAGFSHDSVFSGSGISERCLYAASI